MELSEQDQKVYRDIKACFKRSKDHLKRASQNWESNRKLMMGAGPSPQVKKSSRLAEAYGLFRNLVSQILVQVPEVYFDGKTEAGRLIAKLSTDAVNYDFEIGKLHPKLVRATWQNFPYGFGLIAEDVINHKAKIEEKKSAKKESKTAREIIKEQKFFWRNVPPRDCLFDADGFEITLEDHRFIFLAYYESVENILAQKRGKDNENGYFNLDNIENFPIANQSIYTERSKYFQDDTSSIRSYEAHDDYRQIKLWAMYDRIHEEIYHICDFDERLVKKESWPMPIKIQGDLQFPVKMFAMNADTDGFYPVPEVELIRGPLINLMQMNDTLMTDMTTKLRKYFGLAGYVNKDQLSKFVDVTQPNSVIILGDDNALVSNANVPKIDSAADAVGKLPDITPDPNLIGAMQECRGQIASVTGLSTSAGPGRGPAPRSAREAQRQNDMIQRMMQARLSPLERAVADMATYHILLVKEAGTNLIKRYARVSDAAAGLEQWHQYVPSQLPTEEDVFCDVYTGSSQPRTLDGKREQTLKEISIIAPILEKNSLSLMPLLYRWADVFQVRAFDQLTKNQKGAAMEALASLMMAGRKGKQMNPGVLMNTMKALIDSVLSPSEQQAVLQAMENAMGGNGGPQAPGDANAPKPAGMNADLKSAGDVQ